MDFLEILLIIVSSAGLLHGILFAAYLIIFKKKKTVANLLLGLLLIFMAFRIGKSVLLNFGDGLEPIFIFIGLGFLLLIGPLLRWYVLGMTQPDFKPSRSFYYELIPFVLIFIASLFVTKEWYENSNMVIIVFASGLIFIYLHLAFYISLSWLTMKKVKKQFPKESRTKYQKIILDWLPLLIVGFAVIWATYVLNILDDAIPYVIGPIVYSLTIYFLSYKAFQLKAIELDGNVFKVNEDHLLFNKINELVIGNKLYLESDISLSRISKESGQRTQLISSVINQYARRNFNDYINYYRIQDAKTLLSSSKSEKYTISSIAYDMGFSSLSSFNSAFKKFEGKTPSVYRKEVQ